MSPAMQKTMAWSGAAFIALVFPGFIMAGLLPPFSPTKSAEEVAQFWSTNTELKRCGLVLMVAAAGLQVPFGALLAVRIKQMEGRYSPLAYAQIVAVGLSVMAVLIPTFIFAAASYRPERNPQITQALNDLGWLPFIMNWPAPAIQTLAVGFAIFTYKGDRPVWPRWVGYYNLWTAFILMFGGLVVLFKTGVLAWDGVLAFWVAATAFGLWFLVMTWQLLVIIDKPKADSGGDVEEFAPRQT